MDVKNALSSEIWESNGFAIYNITEFNNKSNLTCYIGEDNIEISYIHMLIAFTELLNDIDYQNQLVHETQVSDTFDIGELDTESFYALVTGFSYAEYRELLIHEFFDEVQNGIGVSLENYINCLY